MVQHFSGSLTPGAALAFIVIASVLSMAGGALAGIRIGGKELGASLAALMGAMFGPAGALPGVILGLLVLAFLR
jgi:hypothetical protein